MQETIISIGELLWDLLPDRTLLGGAPTNLAFRLTELGEDCLIASRVGRDDLGDRALSVVASLGLSTGLIQRDGQHGTGTVEVSFDTDMNPDYVINPHAAYDFIELTRELEEAAKQCRMLAFGTLAQRSAKTRDSMEQLIACAPQAVKFLDLNLRKDCYSKETVMRSLKSASILKVNHYEAEELGIMLQMKGKELEEICEEIASNYAIETILVTLEEYGVFAMDATEGKSYHPGYRIQLEDPLGSGDAWSAAFIHARLRGEGIQDACIKGNILGAAVATTRGATQAIDKDYIERMVHKDRLHLHERLRKFMPQG